MAVYLVPIADKQENKVFIKRFVAPSISNCEDKIVNYIEDNYEFDGVTFPEDYNAFVANMAEYDILIGNITDIELI